MQINSSRVSNTYKLGCMFVVKDSIRKVTSNRLLLKIVKMQNMSPKIAKKAAHPALQLMDRHIKTHDLPAYYCMITCSLVTFPLL